jgi:hypothetical protein
MARVQNLVNKNDHHTSMLQKFRINLGEGVLSELDIINSDVPTFFSSFNVVISKKKKKKITDHRSEWEKSKNRFFSKQIIFSFRFGMFMQCDLFKSRGPDGGWRVKRNRVSSDEFIRFTVK